MNPFQSARTEAVNLRSKLLEGTARQAVHASDLLRNDLIETRLLLGIDYVPKGASVLASCDAILKRNEDCIYVRNDLSEAEQAYLIAHELGHFVLDEDEQEIAVASLKALTSSEGTPAVISVEAYGTRERLELRANVFARELLLPREIARGLHLAGIGPKKAAKDLGIPLEIVRQQMLDAVLLPPQIEPVETTVLHAPSQDQLLAIEASERFVNVVAGPGSGKTSTLVHRVRYLIEDQGVDPHKILVLTFTNKAAFELVERLRTAKIGHASDVWAGTFHAFGLEFLRKYHQCFALNSEVRLADRLDTVTMLNQELPKVVLGHYKRVQDPYDWLPDVVSSIKRLKEELISPVVYRDSIESLPEDAPGLKERRRDVATLFERYEKMLEERKLIDFVDLVAKPATAIKLERSKFSELADKFQHILVDEYQDVTHAMVELITQLAKNAQSLWVVGDVRQAIHHWRGASVHSLTKFNQQYHAQGGSGKIRTYPLAVNRRSVSEILQVVNLAGREHILEKTLKLEETTSSSGASGQLPAMVSCTPDSSMSDAIARGVEKLRSEGVPYGSQAVLSRKNYELELVAAALKRTGIPVLYIGELANRAEVKKILCLMQLLVERAPRSLVGLMDDPVLSVALKDFQHLILLAEQKKLPQRGAWLSSLPLGLSEKSYVSLSRIVTLLRAQSRQSNPWGFVCDLILEHRFGYPPVDDISIEAQSVRIALWQFAYATRARDADGKFPTLVRFLLRQQLRQRIGETYSERHLPPEAAAIDAVQLLSIHGCKGLEFDAVHVNNVNSDEYGPEGATWRGPSEVHLLVPPEALRSSQKDWNFEAAVERNNLLYVAVSRARKRLLMYQSGEDAKKRAPQFRAASTLLKGYSFKGTEAAAGTKIPAPRPPRSEAMPFDELETFARCPLQHWYRFELQLAGEQQVDVSMKARGAVMAALKLFAGNPGGSPDQALDLEWGDHKLPSCAQDPQLWEHAEAVFKAGVSVIQDSKVLLSQPETMIGGLLVRLPWLLTDGSPTNPSLRLVRFAGGLNAIGKMCRPLLNNLRPIKAKSITIHSLLAGSNAEFSPSGKIDSTGAYSAAKRYVDGEHSPKPSVHCKRCAYATFCPTRPTT